MQFILLTGNSFIDLHYYQNKCFKPGRSHHNSDICSLWSLTVLLICLHYDSTDWTEICGVDNDVGQSVIEFGSTSSYGALRRFMCVTVWINFSLYISTFYVLCSSQVCSDRVNVAMNGKVKTI